MILADVMMSRWMTNPKQLVTDNTNAKPVAVIIKLGAGGSMESIVVHYGSLTNDVVTHVSISPTPATSGTSTRSAAVTAGAGKASSSKSVNRLRSTVALMGTPDAAARGAGLGAVRDARARASSIVIPEIHSPPRATTPGGEVEGATSGPAATPETDDADKLSGDLATLSSSLKLPRSIRSREPPSSRVLGLQSGKPVGDILPPIRRDFRSSPP